MTVLPYFPIFLDLSERLVLVLGGSDALGGKIRLILKAGARVRLVAETLEPGLVPLLDDPNVEWRAGPFEDEALEGISLVMDGLGDPEVTRRMSALAKPRNILVNVVDGEGGDFIVPAILDRSPVVVAVSTGGDAPALAKAIRQRLERAIPEGMGRLAAVAGACRGAVRRALADPLARRRFWDRVFAAPAAEKLMGLPADRIEQEILASLAFAPGSHGSVALVGAGPGDPQLLTLQAVKEIETADIILHDALVPDAILSLARRETRLITVGKRAGRPSVAQAFTNRMMANCARRGLKVVRLKGGDPFVFGRGGEELAYLQAKGIEVTVVPGITAAMGAAAQLGIPLTHRGLARSLRLTTASCRSDEETENVNWRELADPMTTHAIYMGRDRMGEIAAKLMEAGLPPGTPAVAVENATRPDVRFRCAELCLLAHAAQDLDPKAPVLLLIGNAIAEASCWPVRAGVAA